MLSFFSGDCMNYTYFDDDKKYIQRIRGLREDHDYSQKYVADYLCTSQTMYARYERDASAMPIRHLIYLAKLYNVSTDYILGLTDMPSSYNELASAETAVSQKSCSDSRFLSVSVKIIFISVSPHPSQVCHPEFPEYGGFDLGAGSRAI